MAIEDSGFGVQSITLRDNSIRIVENAAATLNILPSLHPVFTSDGKDNVISEENSLNTVLTKYGDDFADINAYGQQNLNAEQVLQAGGTAYLCRLLPDNARPAHLVVKFAVKSAENIPLYKRDGYGQFILDDDGNKIPVKAIQTQTTTVHNSETGQDDEVTQEVEVNATTTGIEIKVIVESASNEIWERNPSASRLSSHFKTCGTDNEGFKVFPMFFINYYANGKSGLNYGLRIINDFQRDEKVNDGRRYQLFLVKKTSNGVETLSIGNGLSFSFNPNATISKTINVIEGLQSVYQNYDGTVEKQVHLDFYYENYAKLTKEISDILNQQQLITEGIDEDYVIRKPETIEDFDFINGCAKDGETFDNVIVNEHSVDLNNYQYFEGGSDGDFETLSDEAAIQGARNILLKRFFEGDVDQKTFLNVLKCDAGIIYDANYDMEVKKSMAGIVKWRRDMCVVFDVGFTENLQEAVALAKQINGFIGADGSENFAIVPHAGITVDRAINVRVTGTYEMAYGLTRLYRLAPFSVYAGQQNGDAGCVRKTIFDWVIEQTKPIGYEEKLAKQNKLYWATDLGKALSVVANGNYTGRNVYFYSNANQYVEPVSKVAEFRNSILINDIRRILKLVLVKYTFDTTGAQSAIDKATTELNNKFSSRYPSNIQIVLNLYQTDRDKLLNLATCEVAVNFPDIFESWTGVIIADRQE